MQDFFDLTLGGISAGAVYAALGLALVIIYRATRVVNFAQPALALISTYLAYSVTKATGSYWLGFAVAIVAGTVLGVATERLLIRPLRHRSELSSIIVTLGLLLVLQAVAGMIWSNEPLAFPYAFDFRGRFSANDLFVVLVVVAIAALVLVVFKYTPLGLRMRAAAFAPEVARTLGVRVGLMLTAGWGLARPSARWPGCSPRRRSSSRTCWTASSSTRSPRRCSAASTTRWAPSPAGSSSASDCPMCPATSDRRW
jgi:branched-chain amino acid transport system permease protein